MASLNSWLPIPKGSHFSLNNIPFGVISTSSSADPRPAVAIGDYALHLEAFAAGSGFRDLSTIQPHQDVFSQPTLNDFAALGRPIHSVVRKYIHSVFSEDTPYPEVLRDNKSLQKQCLFLRKDVENHMPMRIGDYTDFFAGLNHAYNCGVIFRGPGAQALQPNYKHLPVGYHGRASSVVVSGTPIIRPSGQILEDPAAEDKTPTFSECKRLDYELELGAFVCKANPMGQPIPIDEARNHIFGWVMMNDWSARDIQAWEYIPLGPFNAKNFGTSISPWVVLTEALEPFMVKGLESERALLPYLQEKNKNSIPDIKLEVELKTSSGKSSRVTSTSGKNLMFSFPQMLAHHSVTGCPMKVGDLLGSGTISGTEPGAYGCLLEQTVGGREVVKLSSGEERKFLEDGDEVTFRGVCGEGDEGLVGFGTCTGKIMPAVKFAFQSPGTVPQNPQELVPLSPDLHRKHFRDEEGLKCVEDAEVYTPCDARSVSIQSSIMVSPVLGFAVLAVIFFTVRYFNHTDVPFIKGLPEPRGVPVFGNLLQLGNYHAKVAGEWAKKLGPVFQVRMGNKRIVFANTFDSVRTIWIHNQSALISRPTLHTFHSIVSSSQGFTIGTSPWDESCKARRKAAATALNKPATQSYMPIVDLESTVSIKEMLKDSKNGQLDVDPNRYFQRFALNTSLTLNYGIRIGGTIDDELLREITHVERMVSNFRSTSNNWQDYIPLLRLWPSRNSEAATYRTRRDKYMTKLLNMLKDKIANGTDKPCITGNILKDPDAKLNEAEIKSICLTMVSAGLDTVPGNLIMGIAQLATPEGQKITKRAYDEMQKVYPNGEAWEKCLEQREENKVPYITALVKEVLRWCTVIPICLPRVSIKDIQWGDATIPAGTTFYMNAWAADYDPSHFSNPSVFNPERYLDPAMDAGGTPHYAYGAGSRMCAGSHLANRELYTAYIRLISAFEFVEAKDPRDKPIMDALDCNAQPTSLTMDPRPFKVGLKVRDQAMLDEWIRKSDERTAHLD